MQRTESKVIADVHTVIVSTIPALVLATIMMATVAIPQVNATGLGGCYNRDENATTEFDPDAGSDICSDRSNNPEAYCLNYGDDPWCNRVDICDDGGEITSKDLFCTGEAVRSADEGCPKGFHSIGGDESGLCYINSIPCPEGAYKIRDSNPTYAGDYYCDSSPPNNLSRIID